ncbi:hypothetical protein FHS61_002991 [Altererythrobacter atlanticus]|uniref:Uncharacterized protein n=1 Tax=Croceibacterium atlanticum TaxID=1267766 RepID=A0A0F7KXC9_9SPHN|nr:hypothetical protein [Croceibacterium atlanticum]AKH44339.1 hypothetical protein WYH_03320 [Croceibacterium atlanticum]MBB5733944.1 hypothetical protein [Croceibacterium atlanticum]
MIGFLLTLAAAAAAVPQPGTVQLTVNGETTTHAIADCSLDARNGMPARLLVQEMDVTLNLSRADHVQTISIIQDNANWAATRMFIGGRWLDRGQPAEPIVGEWGEVIRVQATLTSTSHPGERQVSLIARC